MQDETVKTDFLVLASVSNLLLRIGNGMAGLDVVDVLLLPHESGQTIRDLIKLVTTGDLSAISGLRKQNLSNLFLNLEIKIDISSTVVENYQPSFQLCHVCGRTLKKSHLLEHIENLHLGWNNRSRKRAQNKIRDKRFYKQVKTPKEKKKPKLNFDWSPFTQKFIRENVFKSEIKVKRSHSFKRSLPKKKLFSSLKINKLTEDDFEISQNVIPQRKCIFSVKRQVKPKIKDSLDNEQSKSNTKSKTSKSEDQTRLLDNLLKAIEIERSQIDTSKFGSIFVNLSEALVNGTCKASDLCVEIASSMARLKNCKSNTMIYTANEYQFWEYIGYVNKESCLRNLTGKKAFGLDKRGQLGSQDPSDLEVNLAIPSRTERERNNQNRPVKMTPGCINESLEALKNEGLNDLNISIDEKHVSAGIEMKFDSFGLQT